jgi:hypothetical protein
MASLFNDVKGLFQDEPGLALLTNSGESRKHGVIGGIWIDCTVRERHSMAAEISTHPVEQGSDIADHVRALPRSVALECVISNKPTELPKSHAAGARAISLKIDTPPVPEKLPFGLGDAAVRVGPFGELAIKEARQATVTSFEPPFNRVDDIWKELDAMREEGRLLTVHTSLGIYDDMVIEDVDVPRDVSTFASLRFTITLRKIRTVASEVGAAVDIPRAAKTVAKGKQPAADAAGTAEAQEASTLHKLGSGAGAF